MALLKSYPIFASEPNKEQIPTYVDMPLKPGMADQQEQTDDESLMEYEICYVDDPSVFESIDEEIPHLLTGAILDIVEVEAPVHVTEVTTRIRDCIDLKRAGSKIQRVVNEAIELEVKNGKISRRGQFLWTTSYRPVRVRVRTGLSNLKIDLISDEELAEAILLVIHRQFATARNDLIIQSARLFGFRSTRENVRSRIGRVIDGLIKSGNLVEGLNGLIDKVNK